MYCNYCGSKVDDHATKCPFCGAPIEPEQSVDHEEAEQKTYYKEPKKETLHYNYGMEYDSNENRSTSSKSRMIAGILALFLGRYGIHDFYLGYKQKGLVKLLVAIFLSRVPFVTLVLTILAIYDAVMIFTGKVQDAYGAELH